MAGAAVAGGDDRVEHRGSVQRVLVEGRLAGELLPGRPVRLGRTAEVGAAVRDDREARHLLLRLGVGNGPVVADEGRPPADLTLLDIDDERGDVPLVEREVREWPEVDLVLLLAEERRQGRKTGNGHDDQTPDHGAESERCALEEDATRHGGVRQRLLGSRRPLARFLHLAPLRLDDNVLPAQLGSRVARPEDGENDRDRGADRRDQQRVDDESDEDDDDPDREADRPYRRRRQMRLLVERLRARCRDSAARAPPGRSLIAKAGLAAGELAQPVLVPAPVDELLDLRTHLDLVGPRARALLRPLRGRVDAELAAEELALGRVVEMVERAFRDDHVALRIDVRAGVEEHLLVVVHVHVRVDHDDALREAQHPESPERVHHLRAWPGNCLRIETMQQLWKAPAIGRS